MNRGDNLDNFGSQVWLGQAFSLKVEEVLVHERSKYQDILIFKRLAVLFWFSIYQFFFLSAAWFI